ncbi:hypothetical protein RHMOL_Rhmol01G0157800 [Rhododendron molle]|uniref:Uncharacterized protein n=1 Tax=Rhododendron molle TaxID=49168 RepID=A0ACC0Q4K3_RHOML|nr:hypothetical protein RHMOL_Rhmol01G0157800 [Rhododendron molle]
MWVHYVSVCVLCANGNPAWGTIVRILRNTARRNRGWVCSLVIRGEEPMQMCANGNPARRNHCEDTREPGAAEPRLAHGVTFGDPDILYRWRRWYNVSDFIDDQDEQYTLKAFGAEELARMKPKVEL